MMAVQPHVFSGIHRILNGRECLSEYNNKCVAYMSCIAFKGEQRFRAEDCQSTVAMPPWYSGAPGHTFDLALVVKEAVRQNE